MTSPPPPHVEGGRAAAAKRAARAATAAPAPGDRVAAWWRAHRAEVWLAVVVALVTLPVLQPLMAQQASRYAFTAALVDGSTVSLDAHAHLLGVDRAQRGGHVYSDKAPGQPVWGVPAYAAYRALGGSPAARSTDAWGDLGLWAVSVWSAALPAAALAVVMRRLGRRVVPGRPAAAGAGALSLALATLLLPFATQLFSHVLAGLLGVAAWATATGGTGRWRWLAAGALAGAAVTVEYPMILLAPVVLAGAAWHAARHRPAASSAAGFALPAGAWVAAGGAPFGVALAAYHWAVFGGPLAFPYRFSQFAVHARGVVGAGLPDVASTAGVLGGERGLFTLTPIVAVAVVGLVVIVARRSRARMDALAALLVFAVLVALMAGWSGSDFGGASPGPRYVVPALPWLAVGAAHVWASRWWPVAAAAAVTGTAAMLLATFTLPLAQPTEDFALGWWAQQALAGDWAMTLLTRMWQPATAAGQAVALAVPLVAAGVAGIAWWRAERRSQQSAAEPEALATRGS